MIIRSCLSRTARCGALQRHSRFISTDIKRDGQPFARHDIPPAVVDASSAFSSSSYGSDHQQIQVRQYSPRVSTSTRDDAPRQGTSQAKSKQLQKHFIRQHQARETAHLGSKPGPGHQSPDILANPPTPADVTLELLLSCGAHLGHKTSLWHPGNSAYIFGVRDNIHIISLEATAAHLRRAARVIQGVTLHGGLVLFAGTRQRFMDTVVCAAEMVGGCHAYRYWQPGTLTNGEALLRRCGMKVVNEHDQDVPGFEDQLRKRGAVKPDLVVCLNPRENAALLRECAIHNIPTIGIIDTNTDPSIVTYPIPANDESLRCVQTIAMVLANAGKAGNAARLQQARHGEITYDRDEMLQPLFKPREHRKDTRTPRRR